MKFWEYGVITFLPIPFVAMILTKYFGGDYLVIGFYGFAFFWILVIGGYLSNKINDQKNGGNTE